MCSRPADEYTQMNHCNTLHLMLQSNCRKNFNNVPTQIRKTTPYLWSKKVKTYSRSKTVVRNLGEEVPLDSPLHNKTQKKTEVTSMTYWSRMATITHERRKWPPRSHDRTRTSLSCHQNINFWMAHSSQTYEPWGWRVKSVCISVTNCRARGCN